MPAKKTKTSWSQSIQTVEFLHKLALTTWIALSKEQKVWPLNRRICTQIIKDESEAKKTKKIWAVSQSAKTGSTANNNCFW